MLTLGLVVLVIAVVSYFFIDRTLAYWVHLMADSRLHFVRVAANGLTDLAHVQTWLIALPILFVVAMVRKQRRLAAFALLALVSVALAGLEVNLLKMIFGRERPTQMIERMQWGFNFFLFEATYHRNSFPSGHAATIGAVTAAFCLAIPTYPRLIASIGGVIAMTRVFTNSHYFSDVIVGAYLGALMTVLLAPATFRIMAGKTYTCTIHTLPDMWAGVKWFTGIKIGILLIVAGICAGLWYGGPKYKYEMFPKRLGEVVPGLLFRSGDLRPGIVHRALEQNNIEAVIKLSQHLPETRPHHKAEEEACLALGADLYNIPMGGSGKAPPYRYVKTVKLLHEHVQAGKPILVHCAAGTNRTGGVIAVYRMLVEGWTPEDTFTEMRRYNFSTNENHDLLPYLDEHMPYFAEQLVAEGIIEKVPDPLPRIPVDW